MPTPKVSIIVPCYNQEEYLEEALRSVLLQTFSNWECIIIDDGSTDNSKRIANNFLHIDKRFKYYYQQNSGVIAARNFGISLSIGEFILPFDGDDMLHPEFIQKCLNLIESDRTIRVVYSNVEYIGDFSGQLVLKSFKYEDLLIRNLIVSTALHYKADAKRIGGYDENMKDGLEDWEYWISLLSDGGRAIKIDETLFYYRRRRGTRSDSYSLESEMRLRRYIFTKHEKIYFNAFGDTIGILREKERISFILRNIRKNILYKILRRIKLIK